MISAEKDRLRPLAAGEQRRESELSGTQVEGLESEIQGVLPKLNFDSASPFHHRKIAGLPRKGDRTSASSVEPPVTLAVAA
jgi:hypothetical protein